MNMPLPWFVVGLILLLFACIGLAFSQPVGPILPPSQPPQATIVPNTTPVPSLGILVPTTPDGTATVGGLPTCTAGTIGNVLYVTDASSPTYNATLAGGGTSFALAVCNGTAWVAH